MSNMDIDTITWQLNQYKHIFGDIIFPTAPNTPAEENKRITLLKREIARNPNGYMYSVNGHTWRKIPMDIGKISFDYVMIRRIPDGITIGVSQDIRKNPQNYVYSTNNGYSWTELCIDDFPSSASWIYHGNHDSVWFKKHLE